MSMTNNEMRLRCLEIAAEYADPSRVVETAVVYWRFVDGRIELAQPKSEPKGKGKGK